MPMPNRQIVNGEKYRYAFQGQEKDDETQKEAFQLRLWDARIGRWLTTDPAKQFSSPYLGMGNNPMNGIDPDGGKFILTGLTVKQKKLWNSYVAKLKQSAFGTYIYNQIESDSNWNVRVFFGRNVYIAKGSGYVKDLGFTDAYTSEEIKAMNKEGFNHPPIIAMFHEVFHAWDHYQMGIEYEDEMRSDADKFRYDYLEPRATKFQNIMLKEVLGRTDYRNNYGKVKINNPSFLLEHQTFNFMNKNFPNIDFKILSPRSNRTTTFEFGEGKFEFD